MFRGIISVFLLYSKQRKMEIIPLNLDSVLLLLHNSKLAYYAVFVVLCQRNDANTKPVVRKPINLIQD